MATLYPLVQLDAVEGVPIWVAPEPIEVEPANGKNFRLQELYQLLDCQMVEVVDLRDGTILVCDEEGKLANHWCVNPGATELYERVYGRGFDMIAGSALHCRDEELR